MNRRLVNLGIFSPTICSGKRIANNEIRLIYGCLKAVGFRETRWQFVYEGQTGGLVFPYNHGRDEIHVRFYHDRIFAELEYARSSIFHFVFPLYNANSFIAKLLKNELQPEVYDVLVTHLGANMREDEARCPNWSDNVANADPYYDLLRNDAVWRIASILHNLLSWRTLFALGVVSTALVVSMHSWVWSFLAILTLVSLLHIPSSGRP